LHLGQVLVVGKGMPCFIDFEGEPTRAFGRAQGAGQQSVEKLSAA